MANRGPEAATTDVLPTLWFRNTWSWPKGTAKPALKELDAGKGMSLVAASHAELGNGSSTVKDDPPLLFTENETNEERIFGRPNPSPYVKDGINEYIVHGRKEAVNPANTGTKVSAHYHLSVPPGETKIIRLRLTSEPKASRQGRGPEPAALGGTV